MPSSICLRCLKRALTSTQTSLPRNRAQRAAFTTSPVFSANPPKKKPVVAKPSSRQGRALRLAKNTRVTNVRPPAVGERKAMRKRVVLSNTNALEVQGLQDLTRDIASVEKLRVMQGSVLGFGNDTVDALRALEAFKPTQGWSFFRRPASLVRKETVELAELLQHAQQGKANGRRVLFGEQGSGKSVLMLQATALAHLKGWIVIHFPEAQDIVNAHTSYRPFKTSDGAMIYIQPDYIARLLGNIARANNGLLSALRLGGQHRLPIPVQPNISLARFVELGANDSELAWPIWQALLSELTAPSQPDKQGLHRPPVLVSLDAIDHIMRTSAYLDTDAQPIHAHDLAVVQSFTALLAGRTALPNGGAVVAAISQSNRASSPTLDHYCARNVSRTYVEQLTQLRDRVLAQVEVGDVNVNTLDISDTTLNALTHPLAKLHSDFRFRILDLCNKKAPPELFISACSRLSHRLEHQLPRWDPYMPMDHRVAEVMDDVDVQEIRGLSKDETRGVMEYYARSGMLRDTVTNGLVSEKWTLAGSGIIGEIEKGSVELRF